MSFGLLVFFAVYVFASVARMDAEFDRAQDDEMNLRGYFAWSKV